MSRPADAASGFARSVALVVAVATFMENLDATILATATAAIGRDFRIPAAEVGVAITAYVVAVAAFIPLGAWSASRWGAKRVFLAAIVLFTLSSLACAFSTGLVPLTLARVAQGFAGSMMVPIGRLTVLDRLQRSDLVRAIAFLTWPSLVAPIVAPLAGGLLTETLGWPWVFLVNLPIGIVLLVVAARVVPARQPDRRRPLDLTGLALVVFAIAALVVGFELVTDARTAVLGGALMAAALVAGGIAARGFRRRAHPLLDLTPFGTTSFRISNTSGLLYRAAVSGAPFLLPLLLQLGFGFSPIQAGLTLVWLFIGNLAIKPATTPLLRRLPVAVIVGIAAAGMAITYLAVAGITARTSPVLIAIVFLLSGAFRSIGFTAYNTLQFADVPAPLMPPANAIAAIASQLATGLGVAIAALAVRLATGLGGSGANSADAYRWALVVVAALALASTVEPLASAQRSGWTRMT